MGDRGRSQIYDDVGNLETVLYPHVDDLAGIKTTYHYDERNRLKNMDVTLGTTPRASFDYCPAGHPLSPSGNRLRLEESIPSAAISRIVNYDYDSLSRLKSEKIDQGSPSGRITYDDSPGDGDAQGYDPAGNRRSRAVNLSPPVSGLQTRTYATYNANDWIGNSGSGVVRANFDDNGNTAQVDLNADGVWDSGTPDTYDYENRLVGATRGANSVTIVNDGDGNRVQKTVNGVTTYYLVDDRNPTGYTQVLEEQSIRSGAPIKAYTYGLDLISQTDSTGTHYYGYDGQGSVRFLTDSSGTITDTYTYDAFGILIDKTPTSGGTANNYLYAGEQWDPHLGLYYNRARYYNPDLGRFWTMDTYEGNRKDPLSLHKYLYCGNNPMNRMDPSGHDFVQTLGAMFVVGVISAITAPYTLNAPGPDDPVYPAMTGEEILSNFTLGAITYGSGRGIAFTGRRANRGIRGFVARRIAANSATADLRNATIGELLVDVDDNAMIHLSAASEAEVTAGVDANSYWVRKGDVSHLTIPEYKTSVVGRGAAGYSPDANLFVIKEADSTIFVPNPDEVGLAGVAEFNNTIKVVPDDMIRVPSLAPEPLPSPGPGVSNPK